MAEKVFVAERDMRKLGVNLEDAVIADSAAIVAAALSPIDVNGVPVVIVPEGYAAIDIDVEAKQDRPNRRKGTLEFRDITSFGLYIQRALPPTPEPALLLLESHTFTCILNHHDSIGAGWNDYRAVFTPKWTRGWTAWTGYDNKAQRQEDFARFLEDRIGEIAEPDGATVIEAVRNLNLKVDVKFESVTRPTDNTIHLTYTEDMSHAGKFTLPEKLTLVVAPFEGAEKVLLTATVFCEKPDDHGRVKLGFRLGERVQEILDAADAEMSNIVTGMTGLGVLRGRIAVA